MQRLPRTAFIWLACVLVLTLAPRAHGVRLKDIATVDGVRTNQLIGYGLVVGLDGTGDNVKTEFTVQSLTSMLERMGVKIDPDDVKVKNVAAVVATANLPPFARVGSRVDVLVSSIGDAESLLGGTLLVTPLRGNDGKVYAVAQGSISLGGGFSFTGAAGGGVQRNHPTAGLIASGATVEREVPLDFQDKDKVRLSLRNPDFTTAVRVCEAINALFGENLAAPLDGGTIDVKVGASYEGKVAELMALMESVEVEPDVEARVVLDERTGTVVMGENVNISTVAISHGNLSIVIKEQFEVSQPPPLSERGETVVVPESKVKVEEEQRRLILLRGGVPLRELISALNAIGVSPRDLIAIFQAIKAAGALQARLEII